MRSDEVSCPTEPVIPPGQSSVSNFTFHGPVQLQRDVYQEQHGTGTMHGGGMQQHNGTAAQQDCPDPLFQGLCTTARKIYAKSTAVQSNGWPPVQQSSFINVALLNNEKFLNNELSRRTIRGTVDDLFEGKKGISFEELFSELEVGARVLVEGRPGSGKTTLMNKISKEWSEKKILKRINLLLHIPLRQFYNKASLTLADFIGHLSSEGCHNTEQLSQALSAREDICIILDGVDEYKHASEAGNWVSEVLKGHVLSSAVVIAASRPAASQSFRQYATKRAEVLGFLQPQIEEYIIKYYKDEEEKAAELQTYLQHHPKVHHMCYLPLHLAMVVYLNDVLDGDAKSMPTTETEVYQRFTTHTLLRDMKKDPHAASMESLATPEELPTDRLAVFRQICKLAFHQTCSLQPIFTKKEVDKFLQADIKLEPLGLLTVDKKFAASGVEQTYSFLHLTFQEYLGACYISQLSEQKLLKVFDESGKLSHARVMWRFFCGICQLRGDHQMKVFKLMIELKQEKSFLHLLHCASESQNKASASLLVSITGGVIHVEEETLLPNDCRALAYVLNSCDQKLSELKLLSCRVDVDELTTLSQSITTLPGVKLLRLRNTQVQRKALPSLTRLLEKLPNVEELDMVKCMPRLKKVESVIPTLERLKYLRVDASFGSRFAASVFGTYPSLKYFKIASTTFAAEVSRDSDGATVSKLFRIQGAREIVFETANTKLEGSQIEPNFAALIEVVSWDTATGLSLHTRGIGRNELIAIVPTLKYVKSVQPLQSLDLGSNNLGDEGLCSLSGPLAGCTHLQELDLENNSIGPEGAAALSTTLQFMTSLQKLNLGNNEFGDEGLRSLSGPLAGCTQLQELSLVHNDIGPEGAASLSTALQFMTSLQNLDLYGNNIGPEGAAALSTTLQFMTSLQKLDLAWNSVGDEGLRSLSRPLARCTQLQKLDLYTNELTDESVECLTHLLNSLKDLRVLDVAINNFFEDGKRKLRQAVEARKGRPDFTDTILDT